MELGLKEKSATVAAAGRGLGFSAARSLARKGVNITINARSAEAPEAAAAEMRSEFEVDVKGVAADFNSEEGREAIPGVAGSPDILVNNPDVRQVPAPCERIGTEDWRYWPEVHFLSSANMIQRVAPGMAERKFGQIVNMSVNFIKFPQVGFVHGHAARLALSCATAATVRELIPQQRHVQHGLPGILRHRRTAHEPAWPRETRKHDLRGNRPSPPGGLPGRPVRGSVGMRRLDCISVLRPGQVHVRPGHRQRWRRPTGDLLMRVAMISGGGRGPGAAITRKLPDDGRAVSLGLRKQGQADAFATAPGNLAALPFDATDPSTATPWVDGTVDRLGRLDALVNNAGILRVVDFEKGAEADLDDMWAVNAKAPVRLVRAALPHLRNAGMGRVINIDSTDAMRYPSSVSIGCSMTKHALLAMNQAVRIAGRDDGVRATALRPGAIDTDLVANTQGATPKPGRTQQETVADLLAFLMSLPNQASVPEVIANTRLESPT